MKVGQAALALLGAATVVAGCGSSSGSGARPAGEAGAVHDAVVRFETSPDCDGITDAALTKLAEIGENRQQRCQIARNHNYPDASVVKVRAIKISGSTATAQVPAEAGGVKVTSGGKELVETVSLVKQGGRWMISDAHTD